MLSKNDWPTMVKDFAIDLAESGKKTATISAYISDIRAFLAYLKEARISAQSIEPSILFYYQEHLTEQQKHPNSTRRALIAIRLFFRYLSENGNKNYAVMDESIIPPRDEKIEAKFEFSNFKQGLSFYQSSLPTIKLLRDQAIYCLLGLDGLKISEIISISPNDFLFSENFGTLRILGTRRRVIALSEQSSSAIRTYTQMVTKKFPKQNHPALYRKMFISFRGKQIDNPGPQISRHGIKFMIYELGQNLGIKHLNSECLRHHAINYLLSRGKKIDEIREHFGLKRNGLISRHAAYSKNRLDPKLICMLEPQDKNQTSTTTELI